MTHIKNPKLGRRQTMRDLIKSTTEKTVTDDFESDSDDERD